MKHFYALVIKLTIVFIILEAVLYFNTGLSFTGIFFLALAVSIVSYLVGDLLILPMSNNIAATVSDFILSLAVIFLFSWVIAGAGVSFYRALVASLIIAAGEWVFHKYLAFSVISTSRRA